MKTPETLPLMLFAAGMGTRMGALTRDRPKPLIQVAGRALIDRALDLVKMAPVSRRVVNLHYRGDMIRAHLAGQNLIYSDESDALLETGGGLRKAASLLGSEPVFTLNPDAVWRGDNPLGALRDAWGGAWMDALLLLIPRHKALGHTGKGDFIPGPDGRLTRAPGQVYSGAQIIRPGLLDDIAESAFSLNLLWDRLEQQGRLFGLTYGGEWCDVGRPDSIPLAEEMIGTQDV